MAVAVVFLAVAAVVGVIRFVADAAGQEEAIRAFARQYGLTYPGIGFVVWRSAEHLPEELVFRVNYLGGDMPTFGLNFSRPGAPVLLQYYLFLRLGREGYRRVHQTSQDVATYLSGAIGAMDQFELLTDGTDIPVFAWALAQATVTVPFGGWLTRN